MKKFVLALVFVLAFGFVAAHDVSYKEKFVETQYFGKGDIVISKTIVVDYDDDERYSIYDYRHGYSYRTTREYYEDKYKNEYRHDWDWRHDYRDDYDSDDLWVWKNRDSGVKSVYYEYVPHLREYEAKECYIIPPRDKLFYVKC